MFACNFRFCDCLVGQVVKASASGAEDPGFDSRCAVGIFPGRVILEILKMGTSVATPPGVWRYRVSA